MVEQNSYIETINEKHYPLFMGKQRAKSYQKEYFEHEGFQKINSRIRAGNNVLILGDSLSGKSRLAFESLLPLTSKRILILIPSKQDYEFPNNVENIVVFIDDLDRFLISSHQNILKVFKYCTLKNIQWVITCRKGPEYRKTLQLPLELQREFNDAKMYTPKISHDNPKLKKFIDENKLKITNFDSNIGSLFLSLDIMRMRYIKLDLKEEYTLSTTILLGLKFHYHLLNYEKDKSIYSEDKISIFCEKYFGTFTASEWDKAKKKIISTDIALNFISEANNSIYIEEAYLDCRENNMDVIAQDYSKEKIRKKFHSYYKDLYEARALGFPFNIDDYNERLKWAETFEKAEEIFNEFKDIVQPNEYSFVNLMKAANDPIILKGIYLKALGADIKTSYVLHSCFYSTFTDFTDLIKIIKELNPNFSKIPYCIHEIAIKVAKVRPKENLAILFDSFRIDEIFSSFLLNKIIASLYKDEQFVDDYVMMCKDRVSLLKKPVLKVFLKLCLILEKFELVTQLLDNYFMEDDVYYNYQIGNTFKNNFPEKALFYYNISLENATEKERSFIINSYGRLVYEKKLQGYYPNAIRLCREVINRSNIEEFPNLKRTFLLLIIATTSVNNLIVRVNCLIEELGLGKLSITNIIECMKEDIKKEILKENLKIT